MTNDELELQLYRKRDGMTRNELWDFDIELRGLLDEHPEITNMEVWDAIKRGEAIAKHLSKVMTSWLANRRAACVPSN